MWNPAQIARARCPRQRLVWPAPGAQRNPRNQQCGCFQAMEDAPCGYYRRVYHAGWAVQGLREEVTDVTMCNSA